MAAMKRAFESGAYNRSARHPRELPSYAIRTSENNESRQWRRTFNTLIAKIPSLFLSLFNKIFSTTSEDVGKAPPPLQGKQSGLRTDSPSAPTPTMTPTTTFLSSPTFSHFFLCFPPPSFQHTLQPYLSVYRTPSARFLCQTPPASPSSLSFCLLYCNHFAGPETCGCAGSSTRTRGREKEVTWELS